MNSEKKGCWNIPHITGIYLAKKYVIEKIVDKLKITETMDYDMAFCECLRKNNIFIYVTNIKNFGYIND